MRHPTLVQTEGRRNIIISPVAALESIWLKEYLPDLVVEGSQLSVDYFFNRYGVFRDLCPAVVVKICAGPPRVSDGFLPPTTTNGLAHRKK